MYFYRNQRTQFRSVFKFSADFLLGIASINFTPHQPFFGNRKALFWLVKYFNENGLATNQTKCFQIQTISKTCWRDLQFSMVTASIYHRSTHHRFFLCATFYHFNTMRIGGKTKQNNLDQFEMQGHISREQFVFIQHFLPRKRLKLPLI